LKKEILYEFPSKIVFSPFLKHVAVLKNNTVFWKGKYYSGESDLEKRAKNIEWKSCERYLYIEYDDGDKELIDLATGLKIKESSEIEKFLSPNISPKGNYVIETKVLVKKGFLFKKQMFLYRIIDLRTNEILREITVKEPYEQIFWELNEKFVFLVKSHEGTAFSSIKIIVLDLENNRILKDKIELTTEKPQIISTYAIDNYFLILFQHYYKYSGTYEKKILYGLIPSLNNNDSKIKFQIIWSDKPDLLMDKTKIIDIKKSNTDDEKVVIRLMTTIDSPLLNFNLFSESEREEFISALLRNLDEAAPRIILEKFLNIIKERHKLILELESCVGNGSQEKPKRFDAHAGGEISYCYEYPGVIHVKYFLDICRMKYLLKENILLNECGDPKLLSKLLGLSILIELPNKSRPDLKFYRVIKSVETLYSLYTEQNLRSWISMLNFLNILSFGCGKLIFVPDNRTIIDVNADAKVLLIKSERNFFACKIPNNREFFLPSLLTHESKSIHNFGFDININGEYIAIIDGDECFIYDTANDVAIKHIHSEKIKKVRINPVHKLILFSDSGGLYLWDFTKPAPYKILEGDVSDFSWSHSGDYFVVHCKDWNMISLYNKDGRKKIRELITPYKKVESLCLRDDLIGFLADNRVVISKIDGDEVISYKDNLRGEKIAISPTGAYLAIINKNILNLLDIRTREKVYTLNNILDIKWHTDGKSVIAITEKKSILKVSV